MTARRALGVGLVAAALAGGGCQSPRSGPPEPSPTPTTPEPERPPAEPEAKDEEPTDSPTSTSTTEGVELTWQMSRPRPNELIVSYKIENRTDHRIYVCDKLLVPVAQKQEWMPFPGISVEAMRDPRDTVQLVVGSPSTEAPSLTQQTLPGVLYKPLDPGESHEDSRRLEYPLVSYDPLGMVRALPEGVDKAILTVHAIGGEPPEWREIPGKDGASFQVPRGLRSLRLALTAGPLVIP